MSHFNVLVQLPKTTPSEISEGEGPLLWALQPYQEYGYNLLEDNPRASVEFQGGERERLEEAWERAQNKPLDEDDHFVEKGEAEAGQTLQEAKGYDGFRDFVDRYSGCDFYCGEVGYWTNPKSKYDYFRIGGRWRGHLPVKEGAERYGDKSYEWQDRPFRDDTPQDPAHVGNADIAYPSELDFEAIQRESEQRLEDFWRDRLGVVLGEIEPPDDHFVQVDPFLELHRYGYPFDETRDEYIERRDAHDGERFGVEPQWGNEGRPTLTKLKEQYGWAFSWRTYAVLDPRHGWEAKGEMGWWGMDSPSDDEHAYLKSWPDRLRELKDDTLLVVVDCHV